MEFSRENSNSLQLDFSKLQGDDENIDVLLYDGPSRDFKSYKELKNDPEKVYKLLKSIENINVAPKVDKN